MMSWKRLAGPQVYPTWNWKGVMPDKAGSQSLVPSWTPPVLLSKTGGEGGSGQKRSKDNTTSSYITFIQVKKMSSNLAASCTAANR